MDTMTTDTDALLSADPSFNDICDARRDAAIAHMEAASGLDVAAAYRAHHRLVVAVCAGIVGRRDAEDVAQVVWLLAHRSRASYSPAAGTVATWLGRIARNAALDAWRRARCRPEELIASGDDHGAESPDPVDAIDRRRDVAALRAAIAELPAAQREAVTLMHLDEMHNADAARIAGCEPGAVRVRSHRGLAALREALA
jgi:RNA polymerase sigma-70 factor (ECF subfamily)